MVCYKRLSIGKGISVSHKLTQEFDLTCELLINKFSNMFRIAPLPIVLLLLLSSLFMDTCTAQTFQYSRGWTNGKRSQELIDTPNRLQLRERNLSENIEQFLLERCMLETWNELKKSPLFTPTSAVKLNPSTHSANSNNNLDTNNNNLFGSHHQSNDEQFD